MYGKERDRSMGTSIRAKLSDKNKYYIDKHRYYELKHFCRQYPHWKQVCRDIDESVMRTTSLIKVSSGTKNQEDRIAKCVLEKLIYLDWIGIVENAAYAADSELYSYILKGVTEELSYTYLKSRLGMPCSRDTYYDRYRRFFWYLNKARK